MEMTEQDKRWHLIRNNNGEWISEGNAVFLTKEEARSLQIKAKLSGKHLTIQHGNEGDLWCYKHEIEEYKKVKL